VRERPILFSGPMVRAILDGSKTQTRRVITDQPWKHPGGKYEPHDPFVHADGITWGWMSGVVSYTENDQRCRYGAPGDRLWVREAHAVLDMRSDVTDFAVAREPRGEWPASVTYLADDSTLWFPNVDARDWRIGFDNDHVIRRPSIHMPRWACRLVLELTDVRVERVQAITNDDAVDEGCLGGGEPFRDGEGEWRVPNVSPRDEYRALWDSLNAKRGFGWDVNSWVWVLSFRRVEP
jgi:hypothetical protein